LRRIGKRVYALLAIIVFFFAGLAFLAVQFGMNGAQWATNRANLHIYSGGAIARAGTIYDRNGLVLAETVDGRRRMPGGETLRRATLHAVGDPQGFVSTGAHSAFRGRLTGYSRWGGLFSLIAQDQGNDVTLSIDALLCRAAWEALGGRPGVVGVYNYRTGEVLAMVSSPSYDPMNKPRNIANNPAFNAVYLNRFLHGLYTPGSTFKIITAYAALEHIPEIDSRSFNCTGRFATGEGYVICHDRHGKLNFERAMVVSCNSVFAQLALELGERRIQAAAERLGFNQAFYSDNRMPVAISRFPREQRDRLELGWAGIGQHTTLANPAHMMVLLGAIANEGRGVAPVLTRSGVLGFQPARTIIRLDPAVARRLNEIMFADIDAYDPGRRKTGDLRLGGKTGTAQVDDGRPHAWFVGAAQNPQKPYAIVVVAEHGGSGLTVAFEIAARVMQAIG